MNNEIATRFTRDYGVRHPIAVAPMAFVGTAPNLAIGDHWENDDRRNVGAFGR